MKKNTISTLFFLLLTSLALAAAGSGEKPTSVDVQVPVFQTISVVEVKKRLSEHSVILVDARHSDNYAGWAAGGNKKGGHIAGAVDFSANWLTCSFNDKKNFSNMTRAQHLEKYLADKKIEKNSPVVIYDENGKDAKAVAGYFFAKGIKNIKLFNLTEWKDDLVTYPNYTLYVPPSIVKEIIGGKEVKEIGKITDLKILEISWGTLEDSGYLTGHVPGALHVNSDDFDNESNYYTLDSDTILLKLAASLGITKDSTVICTGLPIFACRYAIILKYLGVKNAYVMSGGTTGWTDSGYELETAKNLPEAVNTFGVLKPKNPDLIDTISEVQSNLKNTNFSLIDNRTEDEYTGKSSGYSYFDKAGRIDGAVYGYSGSGTVSSMLYYQNIDITMRNAEEIKTMWEQAGIDTKKHLSFYCGNGYRAAEVMWDAMVMGYNNVSLFSDGWCGWAAEGLPSVTGK